MIGSGIRQEGRETISKQLWTMANKNSSLGAAKAATGPYSQAVNLNGTVFVSGQIPVDAASGSMPVGVEARIRQPLVNIGFILEEAGLGFDDVVKTTVLLKDIKDFAAMNAVYAEFFPNSKHTRVCCQVATFPKDALVGIDAVAGT